MLPEAQLDRFMIKLSMGYPEFNAQIEILKNREKEDPLDAVKEILSIEEVIEMKKEAKEIYVDDKIYEYVTILVEATRKHDYVRLGISPRGALALCGIARAYISGRNYVTPEDVSECFLDVCRHRLILKPKANLTSMDTDSILQQILDENKAPKL